MTLNILLIPKIPSYELPPPREYLTLTIPPCRSVYPPRQQPPPPLPHPLHQGLVFGRSPQTSNDHFLIILPHASSLRWVVLHPRGQTWTSTLFKVT